MALLSFTWIFEGPATSRTPKPLTIRIGEASLKPQMGEWTALRLRTLYSRLQHVVRQLSNYGTNVLFAMPNGTYDTLHWFSFEFHNHHWVRITNTGLTIHNLLKIPSGLSPM